MLLLFFLCLPEKTYDGLGRDPVLLAGAPRRVRGALFVNKVR